jgi:flagellar hook-basal body complex protein FliE
MHGITSVRQILPGLDASSAADQTASSVSIPSAQLRELNASQPGAAASVQPASGSFSSLLENVVQDVNTKQSAANQALHSLQTGGNVALHQAMIASAEANVSFQLMVETRNRLLEAYQEIMRMQV